jgi:hypothetical protein
MPPQPSVTHLMIRRGSLPLNPVGVRKGKTVLSRLIKATASASVPDVFIVVKLPADDQILLFAERMPETFFPNPTPSCPCSLFMKK